MLTITDLRYLIQGVGAKAEAVDEAFLAHAMHQEVAKVVQTKDWGIPVNIGINGAKHFWLHCPSLQQQENGNQLLPWDEE